MYVRRLLDIAIYKEFIHRHWRLSYNDIVRSNVRCPFIVTESMCATDSVALSFCFCPSFAAGFNLLRRKLKTKEGNKSYMQYACFGAARKKDLKDVHCTCICR